MKRKLICLILAANMVLSGGAMVAFGAELENEVVEPTQTVALVPNMNFTGQTINMSLAQAIERMQTEGLRAETAALNKQSDEAIAYGYAESSRSISQMIDKYGGYGIDAAAVLEGSGATTVNQKIVRLRRDFAEEYKEKNYQAEMNQIEVETVKMYYSVLLAQDQLQAAEDNLQIQKDILANTNKKFELGTVAKIEVLSAENGVVNAEEKILSAKNALTEAKMGFNMLMGYPLMQNVTFTDSLVESDAPTTSLVTAINNALSNRMEVPGTNLAVEVNQILLENMGLTVNRSSSTYKNQQLAVLSAEQNQKNIPNVIEQDVRSKYLAIETKKNALDTSKANLELAQEAYRIASISYDAGMNTLVDVQEAQYTVFQASLGVAAATLDYDMAVYDYNNAQGVGTERITL